MTIAELVKHCHATAREKGWWDGDRKDPEVLALIHSEVSECLEAYRNGNPVSDKIAPFSGMEEELADILIRVFDFAGRRGFDLEKALAAKMAVNQDRAWRHGGKRA